MKNIMLLSKDAYAQHYFSKGKASSVYIKDKIIWCIINGLSCNPVKTEIVHLTSRHQLCDLIKEVNIIGVIITLKQSTRNFWNSLTMTTHVNIICKSAFLAIRNIGKIREYLSKADCEKLVDGFTTSKLNSCKIV